MQWVHKSNRIGEKSGLTLRPDARRVEARPAFFVFLQRCQRVEECRWIALRSCYVLGPVLISSQTVRCANQSLSSQSHGECEGQAAAAAILDDEMSCREQCSGLRSAGFADAVGMVAMEQKCRGYGDGRKLSVPAVCAANDAGGSVWMCGDHCHLVGVLGRLSFEIKLGRRWGCEHFDCIFGSRGLCVAWLTWGAGCLPQCLV